MFVITFELPNGDYRIKRLNSFPKTTQVLFDDVLYSIVKSTWNIDIDDGFSHVEIVLEHT